MKFYSPYQFIPLPDAARQQTLTSFADIQDGKTPFVRHDRWDSEALSGRILCTLETCSPLVVGAQQTKGSKEGDRGVAGSVENYRNRQGLVLPANSLRGMIGNVAEAISQSTLRVLDQKQHTYLAHKHRPVPGDVHTALEKADLKYLLPWNPDRDSLTPAEALFGVVEAGTGPEGHGGRNLASRVRFFDARPDPGLTDADLQDGPQRLKILASPKPPSPALYFSAAAGRYLTKTELCLSDGRHLPNGRKRYLSHCREDIQARHWESQEPEGDKNDNQRLVCCPIKQGRCFHFHLDFENLAPAELALLLAAIEPAGPQAPGADPAFVHRLGLDKPLGLGQVAVRVRGVFLVDRCERYSQTGLFAPRYHRWWGESELQEDPAIQAHYPTEAAAAAAQADPREWPQGLIDPEALSILRTLGDPRATVEHPVCYPFSDAHGQTAFHETEGFHWFVENEQGRQYLPKITPETEALSTLDSKRPAPQDPPRHTPSGSHKDSERQLYVTGITADMSEQVLGEVLTVEFSRVLGCRIDVQRVALPRDRSTGIPRGFGFVTLDSPQSVKRVLQHLEGQRLQVTGGSIRIRRYNPH